VNLQQELKSSCNCLLQEFQVPLAKEIILATGPVGVAVERNNNQKHCHRGKANSGH